MIATALSVIVCLAFYGLVFDYTAFGTLLWSGILLLLPSVFLLFGTAMLLGDRKAVKVYILLAVVLIVGVFQVRLPTYIDIRGNSVTLPLYTGEHEFAFTSAFIARRIAFLAIGLVSIIISLRLPQKQL